MTTRTETQTVPQGTFVTGIITGPTGREFASGGGCITSELIIGYPDFEPSECGRFERSFGRLTLWDGAIIPGTLQAITRWRNPCGILSLHMTSYRFITPDGRVFHGRGCGKGCILALRASKVAPR